MNKKQIILPSNFKFGVTFTVIFFCLFILFFIKYYYLTSISFLLLSIILLLISYIKNDLLLPFNKSWMFVGYLIGKIVSPIVVGFLFFLVITPIGLIMRVFRRDELFLKNDNKRKTFWKTKKNKLQTNSFYNQF